MSDLRDLYQQVILDHYRSPRNFSVLEAANRRADGHNPLCGDRINVYAKIDGDIVREISFQGAGCAISTASASLMTEMVKGKTLAEAKALFEGFHGLLTKDTQPEEVDLGKLEALSGVRAYPSRIKCATLAWHTLQAALETKDDDASVTTE
jgi:nitrogen fixation NifU-like protein